MKSTYIKKDPPEHFVFVDTNILWHEDKSYVVHPDFDNFWEKYQKDFKLKLFIPEVVKGELWFQQSTAAIKRLSKITEEIKEIDKITKKTHKHNISENKIKTNIENKISKWIETKEGKIVTTPIENIVWEDIIYKSIWREPPFVYDPKNSSNEKGFRDTMIEETVIDFLTNNRRSNIRLVFLCNDILLKKSVLKRISTDKRFLIFETTSEFETYLNLTKERLEEQFITSLIRKAHIKFFNIKEQRSNTPKSIYYRDNVKQAITNKVEQTISNINFMKNKEIVKHGNNWIMAPVFIKIDSENVYYWKTRVTNVKLCRINNEKTNNDIIEERTILEIPFEVTWKTKITKDGRFHNIEFLNLESLQAVFKVATTNLLNQWGLS